MKDLTAFQRDLLRIIAGLNEPIGLEVKEEAERYYDAEVNHGRLYPNLDDLVDEGLVKKGEKDGRTNFYRITDEGLTRIRERDAFNQRYAREEWEEVIAAKA